MRIDNFVNPDGIIGKIILWFMNLAHRIPWEKADLLLDFSQIKTMLDIGCGGGAYIHKQLKRYPNLHATGIDISTESVSYAQGVNRKYPPDRCKIINAPVEKIPCQGEQFDIATSFANVCYWQDLDAGLQELHRVLKTDGTILIDCSLCNPSPLMRTYSQRIAVKNPTVHLYSLAEIESALSSAGFTEIEWFESKRRVFLMVRAAKRK